MNGKGTFRIGLGLMIGMMGLGSNSLAKDRQRLEHPEWKVFFKEQGIEVGCILLFDNQKNQFHSYNRERCKEGFLPASTFKIPNALIALETGVIRDIDHQLTWDGIKRGSSRTDWNRDHDLASAMRHSTVWYFQVIARKVGEETMQTWLNRLGYGNRTITPEIDLFWLNGDMRISAHQQISFLRRLYDERLPCSPRSQQKTKAIIELEKKPNYQLSGKTGWALLPGKNLGWFVGYVVQQNNVVFFALNIESTETKSFGTKRIAITKEVLRQYGIPLDKKGI